MENLMAKSQIRLSDGSSYQLGDCFFASSGADPSETCKVTVKFSYKNSVFIFDLNEKMKNHKSKDTDDDDEFITYDSLLFLHGSKCPCYEMKRNPDIYSFAPTKLDVKLACCALIFDSSDRLLLTKRNKNLRSFPSCWVTPGGRLDKNESLEECVLREVEEEVGIKIEKVIDEEGRISLYHEKKKCKLSLFFLYESVFPTYLELGFPKVQNLVMFYLIKIGHDLSKIKVKIQDEEVEKAIWVSQDVLKKVVDNNFNEKEKEINCFAVGSNGSAIPSTIPVECLEGVYPNSFNEGIGEGHFKAIKQHLRMSDSKSSL